MFGFTTGQIAPSSLSTYATLDFKHFPKLLKTFKTEMMMPALLVLIKVVTLLT